MRMTQLRERWQGVSLPNDYLLERWLSGDETSGFFEASRPADGRRVVVKLVPEPAADGGVQLALWERVRALRHPNLRELLDCGCAELAGETVLYAVFEPADDTLAEALGRSPLSEAEARDVLAAAVNALDCLKAQGLALPALEPDQVLAVGEQIKLSTDALREAAADTPYAAALRTFWYKISPCTPARSAEILAQVLGADPLAGPMENPAPVEIPPIEDGGAGPAPEAAAPVPPPVPARVPSPVPLAPALTSAPPRRFPKWPFVAAAGVVLLVLALNRHTPQPSAQPAPATTTLPSNAPVDAPSEPKASPFGETSHSPAPKPAFKPASPPASTLASKAVPAPKTMWRVSAFTYLSRADAARKADQVNRSHPDFAASVFEPKNKEGFYLVAIGGFMTHADAVRLQKMARAGGVSPDVYIQNFVE